MNIVKICGLKTDEEIKQTAGAGADLGGIVVFYPKSKRNIEIGDAADLVRYAKENTQLKMVAVTVSPDLFQVSEIERCGFDYIQIHGEIAGEVLERTDIPIIKAFNVRDMNELDKYKDDPRVCGFVFDASLPGSGLSFDYSLLPDLKDLTNTGKMILLAGGLNPGNVKEALERTGLSGADTSSGVENDEGTGKSAEKIFRFVKNAKN